MDLKLTPLDLLGLQLFPPAPNPWQGLRTTSEKKRRAIIKILKVLSFLIFSCFSFLLRHPCLRSNSYSWWMTVKLSCLYTLDNHRFLFVNYSAQTKRGWYTVKVRCVPDGKTLHPALKTTLEMRVYDLSTSRNLSIRRT